MVFNYEGEKVNIKFRRNGTSYTCEIWKNDVFQAQGVSYLGKRDVFNKDMGRRVALKKALAVYDDYLGKNVEFNKTVWDYYNARKESPAHNEIWISDGQLIGIGKGVKIVSFV